MRTKEDKKGNIKENGRWEKRKERVEKKKGIKKGKLRQNERNRNWRE